MDLTYQEALEQLKRGSSIKITRTQVLLNSGKFHADSCTVPGFYPFRRTHVQLSKMLDNPSDYFCPRCFKDAFAYENLSSGVRSSPQGLIAEIQLVLDYPNFKKLPQELNFEENISFLEKLDSFDEKVFVSASTGRALGAPAGYGTFKTRYSKTVEYLVKTYPNEVTDLICGAYPAAVRAEEHLEELRQAAKKTGHLKELNALMETIWQTEKEENSYLLGGTESDQIYYETQGGLKLHLYNLFLASLKAQGFTKENWQLPRKFENFLNGDSRGRFQWISIKDKMEDSTFQTFLEMKKKQTSEDFKEVLFEAYQTTEALK